MPTLELVPPREWPTLGDVVIEWIEYHLCHGPGDIQGEPIFLNDEWFGIIRDLYRVYPKGHERAGRRVVTYGCVSAPKGIAKSEHAGMLVCAELLGPVRFDGWDAHGKPVGKPLTYPFIRPLATEEGQTGNTYGNVVVMLEHARDKFGGVFSQLDIGSTRVHVGKGGRDGLVLPSTAGAASKDGGKETFAVADEPHLYVLPELRAMHAMVRRNSRKRREAQPWMLATTTMFEPGQGSVAEDLYEEAEKQATAKRRNHGFYFFHREGFEVENPDDDAEVLKSLREAYGPHDHVPLESVLEDEIRAPGSSWPENVRYFLNLKWKGENKAIDPVHWDNMADPTRNPTSGPVLLWFDGSEQGPHGDHTVLGLWTFDPKPHCMLIKSWAPRKTHDGTWKIDRADVRRTLEQTLSVYEVVCLVADPPRWQVELTAWETELGLEVVVFDTMVPSRMGPAVDRMVEAVDTEAFTHDGSPEMRFYALNAHLTHTRGRADYNALTKDGPMSPRKIDGIVAATIGYAELAEREFAPTPTFFGGWS